MNERENAYYTAGELASLFHISKQTLLYYDKMDLLKPEFISENNYRHYALRQYLTLEIIINLRKLDIPIAKIKEYLSHRSPETFQRLLEEKAAECEASIKKAQKIQQHIHAVFHQLQKVQETKLEQITLTFRPQKYFFITPLSNQLSSMEVVNKLAQHNHTVFAQQYFKEKAVGWIIDKTEFLSGNPSRSKAFFSTVTEDFPKNLACLLRPAGLYMTLRFQGTFFSHTDQVIETIQSFMQKNNLTAIGDIYVMPLKNHWLTPDPAQYINQVSMQVDYLQND